MSNNDSPTDPALPAPDDVELLGFVPLLEAYFRRAKVEMSDELRSVFDAHGLTARHGGVLAQLAVAERRGVTELAQLMGVSLSTASELIGDLDRAGIVDRRPDPTNRRRTIVELAEQHRASVVQLVAGRAAPLLRVLEGLSPRDRRGFVTGLRAWAAEVRNW